MSEVPGLACVVLAHADPVHLRRLVEALDPFPVFLHIDAATSDDLHAEMTRDLPDRVTLLHRRRTAWASWEVVAAELDGYRAALELTSASHIALLTGADYPVTGAQEVLGHLDATLGRSTVFSSPLPVEGWGWRGGAWRFWVPFRAWRKHPVPLPFPRRLPAHVVAAGGSQLKVLARRHAAGVLRVCDQRPDIVAFFAGAWIPDECFVPSLLHSPDLMPGARDELVSGSAWLIAWSGVRQPSPPWLTEADLPLLRQHRLSPGDGVTKLFARKFSTAVDTAVLDALDAERAGEPAQETS